MKVGETNYLETTLKDDKFTVCLMEKGSDITKWPEDIKNDNNYALQIVSLIPGSLQYLSAEMQNDKNIVLTAIG